MDIYTKIVDTMHAILDIDMYGVYTIECVTKIFLAYDNGGIRTFEYFFKGGFGSYTYKTFI